MGGRVVRRRRSEATGRNGRLYERQGRDHHDSQYPHGARFDAERVIAHAPIANKCLRVGGRLFAHALSRVNLFAKRNRNPRETVARGPVRPGRVPHAAGLVGRI